MRFIFYSLLKTVSTSFAERLSLPSWKAMKELTTNDTTLYVSIMRTVMRETFAQVSPGGGLRDSEDANAIVAQQCRHGLLVVPMYERPRTIEYCTGDTEGSLFIKGP